MTKYIDARGVRWDSAEEALQDFIEDLPAMTDEETENLFSATLHTNDAATNLLAIKFAADYHGYSSSLLGYYPIPEVDTIAERGFTWDMINDKFMVSLDVDWDSKYVPFFQFQRQEYNRRVLSSLGPPYEKYPRNINREPVTTIMGSDGKDHIW